MGRDEALLVLLEQSAGPDPGDGDVDDVRQRLRRRRRTSRLSRATGAALALAAGGMLVVDQRWSGNDGEAVVAGQPQPPEPGELLFERDLSDGTTLRVSESDSPDEIVVEVVGAGDPVALPTDAGVAAARLGDEALPWDLAVMVPCPGDEADTLQAWKQDDDGNQIGDRMPMTDGLAVVAVPRTPQEDQGGAEVALPSQDRDGDGVIQFEDTDGDGQPEIEDLEEVGTPWSEIGNALFVDFVDGAGNGIRPGALMMPGDVGLGTITQVPIGPVEDTAASGLIPVPDIDDPCG